MTIDIYSATGTKKGTLSLPESLFGARINHGLIHQAVMLQQSNRRMPIAHAKNRNEVAGSSRKLYAQKHTGRARRGSIRSPLLRGGGKAFGPRSTQNFRKDMPRSMRHAALAACLSFQAKKGAIVGLEGYADTVKTKDFAALLSKLPLQHGRRVLIVVPQDHKGIRLSSRNIPRVKSIIASYLNPEDVVNARTIIFVGDAIERAVSIFTTKKDRAQKQSTEETSQQPQTAAPSASASKKPQTINKIVKKKTPTTTSSSAEKPAAKPKASKKKSSSASA